MQLAALLPGSRHAVPCGPFFFPLVFSTDPLPGRPVRPGPRLSVGTPTRDRRHAGRETVGGTDKAKGRKDRASCEDAPAATSAGKWPGFLVMPALSSFLILRWGDFGSSCIQRACLPCSAQPDMGIRGGKEERCQKGARRRHATRLCSPNGRHLFSLATPTVHGLLQDTPS